MLRIFKIIFILNLTLLASSISAQEEPASEYKIAVNDLIEISVYQEADLTKTVRVAVDGTVSYPLLGNISVQGLTAKQLEAKINDLLERDYLINPQVSVFIKEHAKISVLGQVRNPGSYELMASLTALDAIALAGGFRDKSAATDVRLVRTNKKGEKKTFNLDPDKLIRGGYGEKELMLEPGDLVIVGELSESGSSITVLGQVKSPGQYNYNKGMTVVDAVALAGGLTQIAASNGTKVIRMEGAKKKVFNIPLGSILKGGDSSRDLALEVNDTIVIPESFF